MNRCTYLKSLALVGSGLAFSVSNGKRGLPVSVARSATKSRVVWAGEPFAPTSANLLPDDAIFPLLDKCVEGPFQNPAPKVWKSLFNKDEASSAFWMYKTKSFDEDILTK